MLFLPHSTGVSRLVEDVLVIIFPQGLGPSTRSVSRQVSMGTLSSISVFMSVTRVSHRLHDNYGGSRAMPSHPVPRTIRTLWIVSVSSTHYKCVLVTTKPTLTRVSLPSELKETDKFFPPILFLPSALKLQMRYKLVEGDKKKRRKKYIWERLISK